MENRRTFLGLAAAPLLPVGLEAQAPAPRPRGVLARHALTGPFKGFDAVLLEASRPGEAIGDGFSNEAPSRGVVAAVVPELHEHPVSAVPRERRILGQMRRGRNGRRSIFMAMWVRSSCQAPVVNRLPLGTAANARFFEPIGALHATAGSAIPDTQGRILSRWQNAFGPLACTPERDPDDASRKSSCRPAPRGRAPSTRSAYTRGRQLT
jgi:hypothetical protein